MFMSLKVASRLSWEHERADRNAGWEAMMPKKTWPFGVSLAPYTVWKQMACPLNLHVLWSFCAAERVDNSSFGRPSIGITVLKFPAGLKGFLSV